MVQHWNVCAIVFWRVVRYRAGTFLCMRSWPRRGCGCVVPVAAVAVAVVPWTSWPWLWRHVSHVVAVASVASWTWPWRGCGVAVVSRRRVVATRRRMLVFAMVLQCLTIPICAINWLRIRWEPTNKQQRRERKDTAADTQTGTATRKPRRIGGMDD